MAATIDAQPRQTTPTVNEHSLLDLIQVMSQSGEPDGMVMRAVVELVEDGAIRLSGAFRGLPLASLRDGLLVAS